MENTQTEPMTTLHPLNQSSSSSFFSMKLFFILVLAGALGVGSGAMLAKAKNGNSSSQQAVISDKSSVQKGMVIGSGDSNTFKDTTEGIEKEGGISGEGQFHLVRPGGDSQNVYMTSSLVDLSLFVGHKIKVWGQTQKAQHAGWLMDVGKVEVEE